MSLRRADRSSRGVLSNIMCLSVIVNPLQCGDPGPLGSVAPWKNNFSIFRKTRDYVNCVSLVMFAQDTLFSQLRCFVVSVTEFKCLMISLHVYVLRQLDGLV
jgi:hypothetical protein